MKLVRVVNPLGIGYVAEFLTPPVSWKGVDWEMIVRGLLTEHRETTFLLVQFEAKDEGEPRIVGFLLASRIPTGVSLLQVFGEINQQMLDVFREWVESLGVRKVFREIEEGAGQSLPLAFVPVSRLWEWEIKPSAPLEDQILSNDGDVKTIGDSNGTVR